MNFLFISPNYPSGHWKYVAALRKAGAKVLCIGDAGDETFAPILRGSLTEYYRVGDLHDYESVYRACAYFIHKYGRLDRIESLNPYWRDLEARLREEYHVEGLRADDLRVLLNIREAMECAAKAGVPVVFSEPLRSIAGAKKFANEHGYPIAVRPVENKRLPTLYITGEAQLSAVLKGHCTEGYLLCSAPAGEYISCDGLADNDNNVILCAANVFVEPIEKVESENGLLAFYSIADDERLRDLTEKLLKAFSMGAGFFHFSFVRLAAAVEGLGKKGDCVLLEVQFNPPAEYMTDVMCSLADMDVYDAWASLCTGAALPKAGEASCAVVGSASRKFDRSYKNSHEKILRRMGIKLCAHGRTEGAVTGDYVYVFKADSLAEFKRSVRFIQEDFASPLIPPRAKPCKAVKKSEAAKDKAASIAKKTGESAVK